MIHQFSYNKFLKLAIMCQFFWADCIYKYTLPLKPEGTKTQILYVLKSSILFNLRFRYWAHYSDARFGNQKLQFDPLVGNWIDLNYYTVLSGIQPESYRDVKCITNLRNGYTHTHTHIWVDLIWFNRGIRNASGFVSGLSENIR